MPIIENRFIHVKEYNTFVARLNAGDITEDKIVFIHDVKKIWTHNQLYDCSSQMMYEVTYSDLVKLRDESRLIPGVSYRIVDYETTTIQEGTRSANHPFDIIVTALDVNVLSETASAAVHREVKTIINAGGGAEAYKVCDGSAVVKVTIYMDGTPFESTSTMFKYRPVTVNGQKYLSWVVPYSEGMFMLTEENVAIGDSIVGGLDANTNAFISLEDISGGTTTEYRIESFGTRCTWTAEDNIFSPLFTETSTPKEGDILYSIGTDNKEYQFAYVNEDCYTTIVEDPYFKDINLSAWKLNYCLDNSSIYSWADPNGKGVIYRMIDSHNNDCPYDFKNIQILYEGFDYEDAALDGKYLYTFSSDASGEIIDISERAVSEEGVFIWDAENNKISYKLGQNYTINYTICPVLFVSHLEFPKFYNNTINESSNVVFYGGTSIINNNYVDKSTNIVVNNSYWNNIVNSTNIVLVDSNNNNFAPHCLNIELSNSHNNNFSIQCSSITLGEECNGNNFNYNCSHITLDSYCWNNIFEGCNEYIHFVSSEDTNSFTVVQNYKVTLGYSRESNNKDIEVEPGRSYETKIAKDSEGNTKIYCEADLIA